MISNFNVYFINIKSSKTFKICDTQLDEPLHPFYFDLDVVDPLVFAGHVVVVLLVFVDLV